MITFTGTPAGDAAPRLVDIHSHGAVGAQFGHGEEGSRAAAAHHRACGTSAIMASLVTATDDDLWAQVGVLAPLVADGTVLGIHLEGPYLSAARCGAHDPTLLRDPDADFLSRLADRCADLGAPDAIRMVTLAPERDGTDEFIAACAELGVTPAIGHTDADAALVTRAIGRIADATGRPAVVTHLFNGMPPLHHRSGGPVAAALAAAARGDAIVELITDGVHVGPEVARMVFETVGPDRITLISDAMAATGLGDGAYRIGELAVDVREGTARLTGADGIPGSIAGSTATVADCVAWATGVAGVDRADVLRASTVTPAALFPPLT
jgi:N-acetylglucosamine-6-phosphate deacetylase